MRARAYWSFEMHFPGDLHPETLQELQGNRTWLGRRSQAGASCHSDELPRRLTEPICSGLAKIAEHGRHRTTSAFKVSIQPE